MPNTVILTASGPLIGTIDQIIPLDRTAPLQPWRNGASPLIRLSEAILFHALPMRGFVPALSLDVRRLTPVGLTGGLGLGCRQRGGAGLDRALEAVRP